MTVDDIFFSLVRSNLTIVDEASDEKKKTYESNIINYVILVSLGLQMDLISWTCNFLLIVFMIINCKQRNM